MSRHQPLAVLTFLTLCLPAPATPPAPTLVPLERTIDLTVGEAQEVELASGRKVTVKLLGLMSTFASSTPMRTGR
jgi:hypothetical protein